MKTFFGGVADTVRGAACWTHGTALGLAILLAACASPPPDQVQSAAFEQNNDDPLEPLNRRIFDVNQVLDTIVLRPAAEVYVFAVPEDGRKAVRHVLDNMKEPTLIFNNVLQGEFERATISLGRFAINSTVGFGGIIDAATLSGVERQPADFGQTLFVWGAPSGPYLMLPIFGPSNLRDAIGMAVDSYADPFMIVQSDKIAGLMTDRFVIDLIDERAGFLDNVDDLQNNSVDFYAQLRSETQQNRAAELRHGAVRCRPQPYTVIRAAAPSGEARRRRYRAGGR